MIRPTTFGYDEQLVVTIKSRLLDISPFHQNNISNVLFEAFYFESFTFLLYLKVQVYIRLNCSKDASLV